MSAWSCEWWEYEENVWKAVENEEVLHAEDERIELYITELSELVGEESDPDGLKGGVVSEGLMMEVSESELKSIVIAVELVVKEHRLCVGEWLLGKPCHVELDADVDAEGKADVVELKLSWEVSRDRIESKFAAGFDKNEIWLRDETIWRRGVWEEIFPSKGSKEVWTKSIRLSR